MENKWLRFEKARKLSKMAVGMTKISRTMLMTLPLPRVKHLNPNESNPWPSLAPI